MALLETLKEESEAKMTAEGFDEDKIPGLVDGIFSEAIKKHASDIHFKPLEDKLMVYLRIDGQMDVIPKGADAPMRIYEVGGISGRFNLMLEDEDLELVTLSRQIPLEYSVLEGKHESKDGLRGSILKLSKKGVEIDMTGSVEPMTNLKMHLREVDEALATKYFYGKVIERSGDPKHVYLLRFTSLPPEISAFFQAHRQYGTGPNH